MSLSENLNCSSNKTWSCDVGLRNTSTTGAAIYYRHCYDRRPNDFSGGSGPDEARQVGVWCGRRGLAR